MKLTLLFLLVCVASPAHAWRREDEPSNLSIQVCLRDAAEDGFTRRQSIRLCAGASSALSIRVCRSYASELGFSREEQIRLCARATSALSIDVCIRNARDEGYSKSEQLDLCAGMN